MVYRSCEHEYTFSIFVSFSHSPKAVAPKNKICIFLSPLCIYFIKRCIKNSRSPTLGIFGVCFTVHLIFICSSFDISNIYVLFPNGSFHYIKGNPNVVRGQCSKAPFLEVNLRTKSLNISNPIWCCQTHQYIKLLLFSHNRVNS